MSMAWIKAVEERNHILNLEIKYGWFKFSQHATFFKAAIFETYDLQ
jgi:hypothetical protein